MSDKPKKPLKVPSIKASAQARLLLYNLIRNKLTEIEQSLLESTPSLWARILEMFEKSVDSKNLIQANEIALRMIFSHIEKTTKEGLQRQIKNLTGESLWLGNHSSTLVESFIAEHKQLIKSLQREHLDKISMAIDRGIRNGRLITDITKEIQSTTNLSKHRAQLIARNAPLQYSGALTRHNQINAGIKAYIWQSSRDEKVRVQHRKLDGEIFNWSSPGPHPRSEVNCRCDAIPFIEVLTR